MVNTCTNAFDANSAPILKSMDESDIAEEGPLANELFLVELIASLSCNLAFGLSSFKYTGMIGTEIKVKPVWFL